MEISLMLSQQNIQSRFIQDFRNIPRFIDTPNNTIQGFVVDLGCADSFDIFEQEDQAIIFKDNNLWLLVDNLGGGELDVELTENLAALHMLPISRVIVAKRSADPEFDWTLFDVYRLGAGDYGLELSRLGFISRMNVTMVSCVNQNCPSTERYQVSGNFQSSRRRNLKRVSVICGLVVSSSRAPFQRLRTSHHSFLIY